MAKRFGGRFSPGGDPADGADPFRGRRAAAVDVRAKLLYAVPLPLLITGWAEVAAGDAIGAVGEWGALALLLLAAWLLNEGQKAEAAFNAREIAQKPAIPRKIFAAGISGAGVFLAGWLGAGQPWWAALIFGLVASTAHLLAFGIDPLRSKTPAGVSEIEAARVARAVADAEGLIAETRRAAGRLPRALDDRVRALTDTARSVLQVVEADPRDLQRARRFLVVYLKGARDATQKYAGIAETQPDEAAAAEFSALLGDLETSFAAQRDKLLNDDRTALDVEIEVLRERLKQDGLTPGP